MTSVLKKKVLQQMSIHEHALNKVGESFYTTTESVSFRENNRTLIYVDKIGTRCLNVWMPKISFSLQRIFFCFFFWKYRMSHSQSAKVF